MSENRVHHPNMDVTRVRITTVATATATTPVGVGTHGCVLYASHSEIGAPSVEKSSRAKYQRGTITNNSVKVIRIRTRAMP